MILHYDEIISHDVEVFESHGFVLIFVKTGPLKFRMGKHALVTADVWGRRCRMKKNLLDKLNIPQKDQLVLLTDRGRELIREGTAFVDPYSKTHSSNWPIISQGVVPEKDLVALFRDQALFDMDTAYLEFESYMVFDEEYYPYEPQGILYDLGRSQVCSRYYPQFEEVVRRLEAHPQVSKMRVDDVIWANREMFGEKSVIFTFVPTSEQQAAAWEHATQNKARFPSVTFKEYFAGYAAKEDFLGIHDLRLSEEELYT